MAAAATPAVTSTMPARDDGLDQVGTAYDAGQQAGGTEPGDLGPATCHLAGQPGHEMGEGDQRDADGDQQGEAVGARLGRGVEGRRAPTRTSWGGRRRRRAASPARPRGCRPGRPPPAGRRPRCRPPRAGPAAGRAGCRRDPGRAPRRPRRRPARRGSARRSRTRSRGACTSRVVSACIAWSAAGCEDSSKESSGSRPCPVNETGSAIRSWLPATTRRTSKGAVPLTTRDCREQPTRHRCRRPVAQPSPETRTWVDRG